MCTGLEVAALATTLAGTGAGVAANQMEQSAMQDKVAQENQRQALYQQQANKVFTNSLAQSTQPVAAKQIAQGSVQAAQGYATAQRAPISSATTSMQGQTNISQGRDAASQQQSNTARAANAGYSNYDIQQWIKDLDARNRMSLISTNAQNSANVLPSELQHAQHSWDGLAQGGQLLTTVGGLAGMYGALGAGAGATTAVDAGDLGGVGATGAQAGTSAIAPTASLGNVLINRPIVRQPIY